MSLWAIIPVKPLRYSKSRLAHILTSDQRAELTGGLLRHTLEVLSAVPTIQRTLVVSRDPDALKIARQLGAYTYGETEKQDINMALTRAGHIAAAQQAGCILILPSDLPFLTGEDVEMMIQAITPDAGKSEGNGFYYQRRTMAICTDHNEDGTNALLLCQPAGFTFSYGPGSYQKHLAEAKRLGMARRIVNAPGIKFDIDTEEDWHTYQAMSRAAVPGG
jgi:2-phospho-L-lactate guanylyltransferase